MCLIISEPQQQRNSTTALTAPPQRKFVSGVVSPEWESTLRCFVREKITAIPAAPSNSWGGGGRAIGQKRREHARFPRGRH